VDTLRLVERPESLAMNDIARVRITTQRPLAFDAYRENRVTGAFIVIDETTNRTVAAGTIA
jgi:sulfate adenylyltransferase subunit 1 (EFTu-like GTPase family)